MKQLFILSLVFLGYTSAKAQIRTNILKNQEIFIPNLLSDYDSVVYYGDPSAPTVPSGMAAIEKYTDGNIKTLNVYDANQVQFEVSKGSVVNAQSTVSTFNYPTNWQDTLLKTVITSDVNGNDSVCAYYEKYNNTLEPNQQLLLFRDVNGNLDELTIQAWFGSTGFTSIFQFDFFRSNGRLDSIHRTDLQPLPMVKGKLFYSYTNQGVLDTVKVLETNSGLLEISSMFVLQSNAQNQITDITTLQYNSSIQQFEFYDRYQFLKQSPSISNTELSEVPAFRIFPNPADDFITINLKGMQSVEVFTLNGQLVQKVNGVEQDELKLDFSKIDSGIYMFRILTQETTYFRKVLLN